MAQAVSRLPSAAEALVRPFMWDLWWTNRHWHRFLSEYFASHYHYPSTSAPHSFIHPSLTLYDVRNSPLLHSTPSQQFKVTTTSNTAVNNLWTCASIRTPARIHINGYAIGLKYFLVILYIWCLFDDAVSTSD